jgi:lipopolysaccharide export system permease protein
LKKILDRYILFSFLKHYAISFMVLVGLYIVLDMVFNLDELAAVGERTGAGAVDSAMVFMRNVANRYFYQVFLYFAQLSGIIPVVAAGFTLVRLSRSNELTAILAAGVPLLRVVLPIIIASIGLNVILLLDQELILPRIIPKVMRVHLVEGPTFPVHAMQDENGALLNAGRFIPGDRISPPRLEELNVIFRDKQLQPVSLLSARTAVWDERRQHWELIEGMKIAGLLPDERASAPIPVNIYASNVTPYEINLFRRSDSVQLLSIRQINEMLDREHGYATIDLLRVKHARLTQPLMNMVLLLLAIGSLLTREPGRLRSGAVQCLILVGLALGATFLSYQLAGHPPAGGGAGAQLWPALMAWLPIFLFAPVAVWLLDRIKT